MYALRLLLRDGKEQIEITCYEFYDDRFSYVPALAGREGRGSLILLNRLCADINVVDQTFKVCALRCVSTFTQTLHNVALQINIKQLSKLQLTQCLFFFIFKNCNLLFLRGMHFKQSFERGAENVNFFLIF